MSIDSNFHRVLMTVRKKDIKYAKFYKCGKCRLISDKDKNDLIQKGMLHLVIRNIQLFETFDYNMNIK